MGISVGIDLGTTYSAVARIDPNSGKPTIIPNRDGGAVTPSVVAVMPDGSTLYGLEAKEQQELGNTSTAAFFKRQMANPGFSLDLGGRQYSAIDMAATLLWGLVQQAQEVSGEVIDDAYVTVPAYFKNVEREATLEAARRAGLQVKGLLNEPTAAAFAYGINSGAEERTVLIYDLGGGTFDVTIARVTGEQIQIIGSDGSHELGGKDWDDAVALWVYDEFQKEFGIDLTEDPEQLAAVTVAVEQAKKRLSKSAYADIFLTYQGKRGKYRLTLELFDALTEHYLLETATIIERLFQSVTPAMSWADIDGTILVGGSTRMQQVRKYVRQMTGKDPLDGVNVDEAVALGAAIRANQDAQGKTLLRLGGAAAGGSTSKNLLALVGAKKITDATAHALGMISEAADGSCYLNDILIPKNAAIPAEHTVRRELKVRARGGQLDVYLLQGGEPAPLDNEVLGKYVFTDIFPVDGPNVLVDVSYRYNENGVVDVSAVDVISGRQLPLQVQPVPQDMSWTYLAPAEARKASAQLGVVEVIAFIDCSGSMSGEPIVATQRAVSDFASTLIESGVKVGIFAFGNDGVLVEAPTLDFRALDSALARIWEYQVGRGTGWVPGNIETLYSAESSTQIAVFLTDGVWFRQELAIDQIKRAQMHGLETVAIGFGEADEEFLQEISSLPDLAVFTDLSLLKESFSNIARVVTSGTGLSLKEQ